MKLLLVIIFFGFLHPVCSAEDRLIPNHGWVWRDKAHILLPNGTNIFDADPLHDSLQEFDIRMTPRLTDINANSVCASLTIIYVDPTTKQLTSRSDFIRDSHSEYPYFFLSSKSGNFFVLDGGDVAFAPKKLRWFNPEHLYPNTEELIKNLKLLGFGVIDSNDATEPLFTPLPTDRPSQRRGKSLKALSPTVDLLEDPLLGLTSHSPLHTLLSRSTSPGSSQPSSESLPDSAEDVVTGTSHLFPQKATPPRLKKEQQTLVKYEKKRKAPRESDDAVDDGSSDEDDSSDEDTKKFAASRPALSLPEDSSDEDLEDDASEPFSPPLPPRGARKVTQKRPDRYDASDPLSPPLPPRRVRKVTSKDLPDRDDAATFSVAKSSATSKVEYTLEARRRAFLLGKVSAPTRGKPPKSSLTFEKVLLDEMAAPSSPPLFRKRTQKTQLKSAPKAARDIGNISYQRYNFNQDFNHAEQKLIFALLHRGLLIDTINRLQERSIEKHRSPIRIEAIILNVHSRYDACKNCAHSLYLFKDVAQNLLRREGINSPIYVTVSSRTSYEHMREKFGFSPRIDPNLNIHVIRPDPPTMYHYYIPFL